MVQLITPNPYIPCTPGWCLQYVNQAFRVPIRYGSATAAWNGSTTKHRDYEFPAGAWVPIWFSLLNEPNGHVALRAPDGRVFSTTDPYALWPTEHPNLAHLINAYARYNPLTYLGWTEDVEGTPVVASDGIQFQSGTTITPLEEDDMFTEDDRTALVAARNEATNAKNNAAESARIATDARNEATNAKLAAQAAVQAAQAAIQAAASIHQTRFPDPRNPDGYQPSAAEWLVFANLKAEGAQVSASALTPEVIAAAVAKASAGVDAQAIADRLTIAVKES